MLGTLHSLMAATADAANVRQYQDTIALVLLRLHPDLLRSQVLPHLADCSSSGSHALSSLVLIAARATVAQLAPAGQAGAGSGQPLSGAASEQQQQLAEEQQALLAEVVAAVAPWALCHVHALRCASCLERRPRAALLSVVHANAVFPVPAVLQLVSNLKRRHISDGASLHCTLPPTPCRTFAQLVLWRLFELFPSLPAGDATAAALLRFFR